jgi:UDP-N-acetylglucosamine diphosphorylase/glucosamine-1-phosphate N-acetyltransferase
MTESLVLHDNGYWVHHLPLTYTRPVADLRVGILTIAEKWEVYFDQDASYYTQPYLQEKYPAPEGSEALVINAAVLPTRELAKAVQKLKTGVVLQQEGYPIAARIPAQEIPATHLSSLLETHQAKSYNKTVFKLEAKWDVFGYNPIQLNHDFELITEGRPSAMITETNQQLGTNPLFIEEGASIEGCTINTQKGPVYIGHDANIMEGSHLRGPLAVGHNATVKMGAKLYEGTTIGPYCKVAGEISNSVIQAYTNKSHDGFLGNAVLGEWCNLGADTNNSNLKLDYKTIKVWDYAENRFSDSGQQFCGLFMGDHSKTGINTMLNTGTVVGVCSNIFGPGFPRIFIPSFSWGGSAGFKTYQLQKALSTAEIVMNRREVELSEADQRILTTIFEQTQEYRQSYA